MSIAVLIPCLNEAATIGRVVRDFAAALPDAVIYVYDNNSTDATVAEARAAGAVVRVETRRGKGHVVCRMFADIDADIYLMVDGDGTYDASAAPEMVRLMQNEQLDMVSGARVTTAVDAYRPGHVLGNHVLTGLVAFLFGNRFHDMLSGYRVFSRRFVKSFPAMIIGFELETAFAVHALELRMPVAEIETVYKERPAGSVSKLRTYSDGWRILKTILRLLLEERPFYLLGIISVCMAVVSVGLAVPIVQVYLETGLVPRLPTAVLSASLMVLACLCFAAGLILEMVTLGRRETRRLLYLSLPAPSPSRTT
jgi:glycosyltransferase involved in cell wall biosynthesis